MAVGLIGRAHWQRIDGYLDRALDLSPAEREHWLAEPDVRCCYWAAPFGSSASRCQPDEALTSAVGHLSNTVDETHPALIEARALTSQRLKP